MVHAGMHPVRQPCQLSLGKAWQAMEEPTLRHPPILSHTSQARIHMLLDVAESPRHPRQLQPGEVCEYGQHIVCAPATAGGEAGDAADAARDGLR